jgi:YbgC/YbaW family acyl-CoA thioester hydrolase
MGIIPTYDDTNSVGNVYFANYIRWVGKTRELFFAHCMPAFDLKTTRFYILTKSIKHDFRREVAEFQAVKVRIRIGEHNRKFVTLEHEILAEDGGLIGKGSQALMFVDSQDYRPLDIPKDVVAGFLPHWPKDSKLVEKAA